MGPQNKVVHLQAPDQEDVPEFYVNQVNMTFSVYDVTFSFGTMPLPANAQDGSDEAVVIRMSPQHAKVFSRLLHKNLEKYEKDIGNISISGKLLKELGIE